MAIGKNGVYYGTRLGKHVPWCDGYPFNVISHPQYAGVVLSLLGVALLLVTPAHLEAGWLGLFASNFTRFSFFLFLFCPINPCFASQHRPFGTGT
jgi:hypothetical protein